MIRIVFGFIMIGAIIMIFALMTPIGANIIQLCQDLLVTFGVSNPNVTAGFNMLKNINFWVAPLVIGGVLFLVLTYSQWADPNSEN
jgi:hypothetical protein